MSFKSNPSWIALDIETKPKPELVRRFSKEFPAIQPFVPAPLKIGNMKDPAKIAEKTSDHEAAQRVAEAGHIFEHVAAEAAYWAKLEGEAALNPWTAEIVAIGMIDDEYNIEILLGEDKQTLPQAGHQEIQMLSAFWDTFRRYAPAPHQTKFVHWSGNGSQHSFDLGMLVTRSRIRGVQVPASVRRGRFWSDSFVDLAAEWLLNDSAKYCSLTRACDILGLYEQPALEDRIVVPKKPDDLVQGVNCWQWLAGTFPNPEMDADMQRQLGIRYLRNDLVSAMRLAEVIL